MSWLMLCLGVIIALLGFLDMLSSTLGLGGGFVARRLIRYLWWPAVWVNERLGGEARLLRPWGMALNLLMLFSWIVMIILGWFLVFSSSDWAVVSQETQLPDDPVARLQFTVSTLSGLGRGLSRSGGSDAWSVLTIIASLGGTFVISFAISFLIPVIQAATQKRALAHRISLLGDSPIQILETYCEDGTSDALQSELRSLIGEFVMSYEQHRTYPSVHLLFSSHRYDNMALNLVILDEAMSLLRSGFPKLYHARPSVFDPMRTTMTRMLNDLDSIYVNHGSQEMPAEANDAVLIEERIACVFDHESFREAMQDDDLQQRRQKLGTLLRNNGWTWNDVYSAQNTDKKEQAEEESIETST